MRRKHTGRTPPPFRRAKRKERPSIGRPARPGLAWAPGEDAPPLPPPPPAPAPGPGRGRGQRRKYPMACAYCGDVFMAVRSDAKYCSPSHRTMAHRDRAAAARPAPPPSSPAPPPALAPAADQERPAVDVDLGAMLAEAQRLSGRATPAERDRAKVDPEFWDWLRRQGRL